MKRSIATTLLVLGTPAALGFAPSLLPRTPSPSSLSMARRGKGLSVSGGGNKLSKPKSIEGSEPSQAKSAPRANWVQTSIPSIKSLPKERGVVKFVDTNVPSLVNKQTNPTGAVSVVNQAGKTYCFSSSCPSCKIPLGKSKVLDPNDETGDDARLECDFCGSTYNLRTGMPTAKEGGKMMAFLFSKSEDVPLPVYGLGEQGGKVFINVP